LVLGVGFTSERFMLERRLDINKLLDA